MGGHISRWYFGIVEAEKSDKLFVSHMIHADSKAKSLTFPEAADILETSIEQVISSKVKVQYLGSVRIRCNLVFKTLTSEMDNIVNSMKKK